MAEYLYLFRACPEGGVPPEEWEDHVARWRHWLAALKAAGTVKGGQPLEEEGKVLSGQPIQVTDGPYAESKEVVGGYLVVEAASEEEAVEIARGCPSLEAGGSVEVRQIHPMEF